MRAPNMLALVLLAVALGGCPTTSTPPPYTVTEARYCLGVGSAYNRVLFVTVAEHPTECVIVSFSAADEVLGEGFAQAVSVPCADVFFDGSWNFGPVSSVLSATALARMEIEIRRPPRGDLRGGADADGLRGGARDAPDPRHDDRAHAGLLSGSPARRAVMFGRRWEFDAAAR